MKTSLLTLALAVSLSAACHVEERVEHGDSTEPSFDVGLSRAEASSQASEADAASRALATFAGGCFWCMETPFEELPGVSAVISGYTGGAVVDPTYEAVCRGSTGHTEAIQIHFDPRQVSYGDLLQVFWRQIDPTDTGGQFVDRGNQYRPEIFYHDEEQRLEAEGSKEELGASGRFEDPIAVAITPYDVFYAAEEYHQDFYEKSPERYYSYRKGSGRDRFIDGVWGEERDYTPVGGGAMASEARLYTKPPEDILRSQLTRLQYEVTQEDGTERPFQNEFWDNHEPGIYVDIVSGQPLFSSLDKFDSGTGWPSFTRPLDDKSIQEGVDHKLGYARDEVRSSGADSHLGHVFGDGPKDSTGLRYCINSAALRFVPVADLEREGYGEYAQAFEGHRATDH